MLGLNKKIALALIGAGAICLAGGVTKADSIYIGTVPTVSNNGTDYTLTYTVTADSFSVLAPGLGDGFTLYDYNYFGSAAITANPLFINAGYVAGNPTPATFVLPDGGFQLQPTITQSGTSIPGLLGATPPPPGGPNLNFLYVGPAIVGLNGPNFSPSGPVPDLEDLLLTITTTIPVSSPISLVSISAYSADSDYSRIQRSTLAPALPLPSAIWAGGLLMAGLAIFGKMMARQTPKIDMAAGIA